MSMMTEDGARLQESMRSHPSVQKQLEFPYPLKGIVQTVYYKDDTPAKQYLADIQIMSGYGTILPKVPFAFAKINKDSGMDWSPETGDIVVVQFIGGRVSDPIITGYCALPQPMTDSDMQAAKADAPDGKRRYRLRCNNTSETIDKEGNRIIDVAKDETVTIKGNGTVTIAEGDLTIEVTTGKATISVKGNADITVEGTTTVTSPTIDVTASTKVKMTTPLLQVTGNITAANVTAATNVFDQNGTKSMAGMRTTFNSHTHPENGTGGGTTSAPTAQQ